MKSNMLLVIFVGLIAKLTLVSGDNDENNFDWNKISGPRPWYFLLHKDNEYENQLGCPVVTLASPSGNISFVTVDVYDYSKQRHVQSRGNATNWNRNGYFEVLHEVSIWSGQCHVIAVDYELYAILSLDSSYRNEEPLYVAYRSYHPAEGTVNTVKQKLREKNIDISELVEWRFDNCQPKNPEEKMTKEMERNRL